MRLPTWCWRTTTVRTSPGQRRLPVGIMAGVHEDWMERLRAAGFSLDRISVSLTEAMEIRRNHKGLTSPELAVLLAYTKIVLEDEILASDLPDDPYLEAG